MMCASGGVVARRRRPEATDTRTRRTPPRGSWLPPGPLNLRRRTSRPTCASCSSHFRLRRPRRRAKTSARPPHSLPRMARTLRDLDHLEKARSKSSVRKHGRLEDVWIGATDRRPPCRADVAPLRARPPDEAAPASARSPRRELGRAAAVARLTSARDPRNVVRARPPAPPPSRRARCPGRTRRRRRPQRRPAPPEQTLRLERRAPDATPCARRNGSDMGASKNIRVEVGKARQGGAAGPRGRRLRRLRRRGSRTASRRRLRRRRPGGGGGGRGGRGYDDRDRRARASADRRPTAATASRRRPPRPRSRPSPRPLAVVGLVRAPQEEEEGQGAPPRRRLGRRLRPQEEERGQGALALEGPLGLARLRPQEGEEGALGVARRPPRRLADRWRAAQGPCTAGPAECSPTYQRLCSRARLIHPRALVRVRVVARGIRELYGVGERRDVAVARARARAQRCRRARPRAASRARAAARRACARSGAPRRPARSPARRQARGWRAGSCLEGLAAAGRVVGRAGSSAALPSSSSSAPSQ